MPLAALAGLEATGNALQRPPSAANWTPKEAHLQVEQFIDRFSDPQHFHLTTREN